MMLPLNRNLRLTSYAPFCENSQLALRRNALQREYSSLTAAQLWRSKSHQPIDNKYYENQLSRQKEKADSLENLYKRMKEEGERLETTFREKNQSRQQLCREVERSREELRGRKKGFDELKLRLLALKDKRKQVQANRRNAGFEAQRLASLKSELLACIEKVKKEGDGLADQLNEFKTFNRQSKIEEHQEKVDGSAFERQFSQIEHKEGVLLKDLAETQANLSAARQRIKEEANWQAGKAMRVGQLDELNGELAKRIKQLSQKKQKDSQTATALLQKSKTLKNEVEGLRDQVRSLANENKKKAGELKQTIRNLCDAKKVLGGTCL